MLQSSLQSLLNIQTGHHPRRGFLSWVEPGNFLKCSFPWWFYTQLGLKLASLTMHLLFSCAEFSAPQPQSPQKPTPHYLSVMYSPRPGHRNWIQQIQSAIQIHITPHITLDAGHTGPVTGSGLPSPSLQSHHLGILVRPIHS